MAKPAVRLTVIGAGFAVGLAALAARAAQVQLVDGATYAARATAQRTDSIVLPARRGGLFDRDGVPLATTEDVYHVGLNAKEFRAGRGDVALVARRLGVNEGQVRRALRRPYAHFEGPYPADRVHPLRGVPGVYLETELVRTHPDPDFARLVLGRPAMPGRPASGLERVLDSLLAGTPGRAVVLRDGRGRRYESPARQGAFPVSGHDVYLTLDATIQDIVETALAEAIERLDAAGGDVVVLEPHSGEILALASRGARGAPGTGVFTSVFEPGSTAKVFAAAALLEHQLVEPTDSVYAEAGKWVLPYRTMRDDHEFPRAWMTFAEAIRVSSNIGTVKFAQRLTPAQQYEMLRAFGIGAYTGVEYPAEARGRLPRPDRWSGTTAQSLAIGYELSVTPLHLAQAYAAIASEGVLMRPTLVHRVRDAGGRIVYRHRPEPVRRVVQPATAARLRELLREVVTEGGTGRSAALSTYELAGKTGTARVAGPRGYVPGAHTAVFASLFPAENPQLVMVVKLDSPRGAYAALTAAPLTRSVLEQVLAARTGALDRRPLAVDAPPEAAPAADADDEPAPRHVVAWPPVEEAETAASRRVPNVVGLSLREAAARLHRAGLQVRATGFGTVSGMTPPAGDSVAVGSLVTVRAEGRSP